MLISDSASLQACWRAKEWPFL